MFSLKSQTHFHYTHSDSRRSFIQPCKKNFLTIPFGITPEVFLQKQVVLISYTDGSHSFTSCLGLVADVYVR